MRLFLLIDPLTPDQPDDLRRLNRSDSGSIVMAGRRVGRELMQTAEGDAVESFPMRLAQSIAQNRPGCVILNAPALGKTLTSEEQINRLASTLLTLAADIVVISVSPEERAIWQNGFGSDAVSTPEEYKADLAIFTDPGATKSEIRSENPYTDRSAFNIPSLYAPRNDIVGFDETKPLPNTTQMDHAPMQGTSGVVVIACMKNEGPYILEWLAYHQTIGVHHFVIYSNDCSDGTDEMLDRLQELGFVTHVRNDQWKGKSPQQHALNRALKLKVVKEAEWLIHIDADEFINIRTGNGTFQNLLDKLPPETTNIAMTWRQFGNAGVSDFQDLPVIEQFDRCAPSYLPKPHTAWGFKTATKNIGAYTKLSCHRPNKVRSQMADQVFWVNGSGDPIEAAKSDKVWRSDIKRIGYDLVQLNHYALRSLQAFLIKRQRGRALHVDRTIGAAYWVRMDWNSYQDISIKRNLPRCLDALAKLKADGELERLHNKSVRWHKNKINELMAVEEFRDLHDDIRAIELTDQERIEEFKRLGVD